MGLYILEREPPNLTAIGHAAFSKCTSLSKIALPPNLAEIGEAVFLGARR